MSVILVRKKPVEVTAIQFTGANTAEVQAFTGADVFYPLDGDDRANCDDPEATASVYDRLHSTWVLVYDGQWIIRGIKGEFYPCAADVFTETYELVTEDWGPWDRLLPQPGSGEEHPHAGWSAVAQAVVNAATEGSLHACGYTLADVARFLESEAAAPAAPQATPERSVTANRLGHALAALREIAEPAGDEFPRDTARNALDDDRALRAPGAGDVKPAPEPQRFALIEQMGHRSTIGAVRETTFCGKPMLEVTDLRAGSVHLVSPESLYEVTWLTEEQTRQRVTPWTAVALPATAVDVDEYDGQDADDEGNAPF